MTQAYATEWTPRILRDVDDGVLVLDRYGHILYMNPPCSALLGVNESALGSTYAETFFRDGNATENDRFHQFVLDAVYQKDEKHQNNQKGYTHMDIAMGHKVRPGQKAVKSLDQHIKGV